jgi:hypothetical protein
MILQRVLGFVFMVIFFGGMGVTILAFLGRRHTMLNGEVKSLPQLVNYTRPSTKIESNLVLGEVLALRGAMSSVGVSRAQMVGSQAWEVYLIDNQGSVLSVHVSTSLEDVERLARGLSENLEIPILDPDLLLASI